LQLSADEVARLSPQRNIPDRSPPLLLFVGGNELPELKRQSEDYAAACRARGLPVSLDVLPGHNHFSIVDEISKPDGALTRALRGLIVASG
jgi:arylformamidase